MSELYRYGLFASLLLLTSIGCNRDGKLNVGGTATWNGQPIEQGYIELQPTDGVGQVEGAEIINGKFMLRSHPGQKRVSVVAKRQVGETKPSERIPEAQPIYKQVIPPQFNTHSVLTETIDPTDPRLTLDLLGEESSANQELTPEERRRKAMQGGKS